MIAGKIIRGDVKVIDAGREARAIGQRLYIDERGNVIIAPRPQPGWTSIAVKIKTPIEARLEEALPCAA